MKEEKSSKLVRAILFIAFLLTILFTLLSGVGTYCAAFDTEKYPSMLVLLPYQWLYQMLFVASVSIGLWGLWEIIASFWGKSHYQRRAILILSLGLGAATIQMIASEILRGSSVPVNFRVYVTLFTLILFLLVRVTPLRQLIGLANPEDKESAGVAALGTALFLSGAVTLTTPLWVGNSHVAANAYNWVYDLKGYLIVFWGMLVFSGLVFLVLALKQKLQKSSLATPVVNPVD